MIDERVQALYEIFQGLPNGKSIVRNNQMNDAYTIFVYETLFKSMHGISEFKLDNIELLSQHIVPPPDNGIDIFIQQEDGDETFYHIAQVKNMPLAEHEIKNCFAFMKRSVEDYLNNPKNVTKNLRTIISSTEFDETVPEENRFYYVIHSGDSNYIKNLRKNERIVTNTELSTLRESMVIDCVPKETFRADNDNNYILYRFFETTELEDKPRALLCNLKGYDLAVFANRYTNTELGRNILFGQNLRESLDKKSKTYKAMFSTIDCEPDKFWYYNNGISIIAEEFDVNKNPEIDNQEIVDLTNFSIINGAQTVSTLGAYLKEAELDRDTERIEKLKKVFVLTRIVEIKKDTELRDDISIFNNTQNPISTRDMASNRHEQKELNKWLLDQKQPRIYVEIKRGRRVPGFNNFYPHQKTTNELLAQLAFSGFLRSPFIAKDKKSTIFNNDYSSDYLLNKYYQEIFNYDTSQPEEQGIIFKKTKYEIDELLFVYHLHNETKKYLKSSYKSNIDNINLEIASGTRVLDENTESELSRFKRLMEIANVCHFFNLALYYEFKSRFDRRDELEQYKNKSFDYAKFYDRRNEYRQNLIRTFASCFFQKTIKIIRDKSGQVNTTNWIREKKNENSFLDTLRDDLSLNVVEYFETYRDFVKTYKTFQY